MAAMIHSKYGYDPPEWVQADAHLDKWMKRRAKQHGAFSLENKTKPVYQASQGDGFKLENKG
ncbi:prophage protein 32 [Lactiplantibacillus plantarum]|nr:prophage protein 32 [Lactiplantibacillus plantarum]MCG0598715.1 prophage protein 32 [Lactiplantibacillus plantarum]MCG0600626.1 prophage protein 32 [Lactiplantibacillus plantarum]MCG0603630.1 prophage protein 32 [Lactiplantibacillus plantarum]MCG0741187.1 prophage protein 32 [Lactiplantibacillus plantarum]